LDDFVTLQLKRWNCFCKTSVTGHMTLLFREEWKQWALYTCKWATLCYHECPKQ